MKVKELKMKILWIDLLQKLFKNSKVILINLCKKIKNHLK